MIGSIGICKWHHVDVGEIYMYIGQLNDTVRSLSVVSNNSDYQNKINHTNISFIKNNLKYLN